MAGSATIPGDRKTQDKKVTPAVLTDRIDLLELERYARQR